MLRQLILLRVFFSTPLPRLRRLMLSDICYAADADAIARFAARRCHMLMRAVVS